MTFKQDNSENKNIYYQQDGSILTAQELDRLRKKYPKFENEQTKETLKKRPRGILRKIQGLFPL